jgi:phage/plasmid-like protein (TIGR03299 family)
MAHQITDTDNLFSVREMPWHGLGVVLDGYPTRTEAQQIALPWEPISEPVYRREVGFDADGQPTVEFVEIEGSKEVRRTDNGAGLGVVNDTYEPVSNTELFDIAEAVQGEASDVRFETAGSLDGGRKVWVLLRLDEPIQVPGDPNGATIAFYALQNSHNGTGSLRGQGVNTRIVCANTSTWADMEAQRSGHEFTFRHSKNVKDRIEDAKQALAGWRTSVNEWLTVQEHLVSVKVTRDQQEAFIEAFVPMPAAQIVSKRVQTNVANVRSTLWDILGSETSEGVDKTAYGLVQAAVEYAQHYRRTQSSSAQGHAENRFSRAMLDRSELTRQAVRIVRQVAAV